MEIELIIDWFVAVPADWKLEACPPGGGAVYEDVSGSQVGLRAGTRLRGGPPELLNRLVAHKYAVAISQAKPIAEEKPIAKEGDK